MRRKIWKSIAIGMVSLLILAGCGNTEQPDDESAKQTADTEANAETNKNDVTQIAFWDMMWGEAGTYDVAAEALVDQYNEENPDIHVEYQSIPWDNYYQTFLTAITSGTGPSAQQPQTVYWANSIAAYNKDPEKSEAILDFTEWWVKNSKTLFTDGRCGKAPVIKSFTEDEYYEDAVLENLVNTKIMPTFVHATEPIQNFYPAFGQINGERYLGNAAQKVLGGRRDYETILEEDNGNVEAALELQEE